MLHCNKVFLFFHRLKIQISAKKGVMDEDAVCKAKKEYKQVTNNIFMLIFIFYKRFVDLSLHSNNMEPPTYDKL